MKTKIWQVKEVPTFPCCWKVFPISTFRDDNCFSNYFKTKEQAEIEAEKRNKQCSTK